MYAIAFLLLPEFSLLGAVSATETLRVANSLYPEQPFRYIFVHDTHPHVASSSGIPLQAEMHVRDLKDFDALVVLSSFRHDSYENAETQSLIRRFDRHGKTIGSIESGVYHLAKAGVLNGHMATAHFNNLPMFAELFPQVSFVKKVYTWSEKRMTCAGGAAATDMMLHLVSEHLGKAVAARVANIIIFPYRREIGAYQDDLFTSAYNGFPQPVREACRMMEEAIHRPLEIEAIAEHLGVIASSSGPAVRDRIQLLDIRLLPEDSAGPRSQAGEGDPHRAHHHRHALRLPLLSALPRALSRGLRRLAVRGQGIGTAAADAAGSGIATDGPPSLSETSSIRSGWSESPDGLPRRHGGLWAVRVQNREL